MPPNNTQELFENIVNAQIEDPKAPLGVFQLPCGFLTEAGEVLKEVEVREITGAEEDILAAKQMPGLQKLSTLLARCTERIGEITDKQTIKDMILDLPVGDRIFLLFAIRRVTLGEVYPFLEKCPECKTEKVYQLDLSTLQVKAMNEPAKRVFDTKLPSGKEVRYHVMTGRDEEKLAKLSKGGTDSVSLTMLARIDLINGKAATLDAVKAMSMRDRNFLRDLFEEIEGGMETTIDVQCAACEHEFTREMEIDRSFFSPSALQKDSKRKSST